MNAGYPFALRLRGQRKKRFAAHLAYGYLRVSKDDQEIEAQKNAIWAHFQAVLEPRAFTWGGWVEEIGVSAKTKFLDRPQGFQLSQRLEGGDAFITSKLDRGFRNTADCLDMVELWQDRGVEVYLLDVKADTTTPEGKAQLTMLAMCAEYERNRISERTKEGLAARKAAGRPWAPAPYGYLLIGKRPNSCLAPDLVTCAEVRKMVAWNDAGASGDMIFLHLLRHRVIYARTGRPWQWQWIVECMSRERRLSAGEQERGITHTFPEAFPGIPDPVPRSQRFDR